MTKSSKFVKDNLTSIIKEMAKSPESFVKNPDKDFTRNRKLTFEYVINLLLSMGGNNIYKELLEYFKYDVATATSSAFVQQRKHEHQVNFTVAIHICRYYLDAPRM